MAHRKNEDRKGFNDYIAERKAQVESYPVIREEWYVVEIKPPVQYSNEYEDGWTDRKIKVVSDYFSNKEEADAFVEEWEPDPGNSFAIKRRVLRAVTRHEYFPY